MTIKPRTTATGRRPAARATTSTRRRAATSGPPTAEEASRLGSFPPPRIFEQPVRTVGRDGNAVFSTDSEQLAVANLPLASDRARRFAVRTGMGELLGDLEAVAWTGLLNACRRYSLDHLNPATGRPCTLSTVAVLFIDGAMRRYLRDRGHAIKFPNEWREKAPKARREVMHNKKTIEQAAAMVGMDPMDVAEMLHCMGPTGEIEDDNFQRNTFLEDLPDEEEPRELAAELHVVNQALKRLGDDRLLLVDWWETPRRRGCPPSGPLQQFLKRARRFRANQPQDETIEQMSLLDQEDLRRRAVSLGLLHSSGEN
jgi:DNA-directed RNA polymerase specialized sigma subunit